MIAPTTANYIKKYNESNIDPLPSGPIQKYSAELREVVKTALDPSFAATTKSGDFTIGVKGKRPRRHKRAKNKDGNYEVDFKPGFFNKSHDNPSDAFIGNYFQDDPQRLVTYLENLIVKSKSNKDVVQLLDEMAAANQRVQIHNGIQSITGVPMFFSPKSDGIGDQDKNINLIHFKFPTYRSHKYDLKNEKGETIFRDGSVGKLGRGDDQDDDTSAAPRRGAKREAKKDMDQMKRDNRVFIDDLGKSLQALGTGANATGRVILPLPRAYLAGLSDEEKRIVIDDVIELAVEKSAQYGVEILPIADLETQKLISPQNHEFVLNNGKECDITDLSDHFKKTDGAGKYITYVSTNADNRFKVFSGGLGPRADGAIEEYISRITALFLGFVFRYHEQANHKYHNPGLDIVNQAKALYLQQHPEKARQTSAPSASSLKFDPRLSVHRRPLSAASRASRPTTPQDGGLIFTKNSVQAARPLSPPL